MIFDYARFGTVGGNALRRNVRRLNKALADGLRPPPRMTVSEWAADFRKFPEDAPIPGDWDHHTAPELVEIMDALSPHDPCEEVILPKCAQSGGSASAENWLGFISDLAPGPVLFVQATFQAALDWAAEKFWPMVEASPRLNPERRGTIRAQGLANGDGSTSKKVLFSRSSGYILLAGANSAAGLRQRTVRYAVEDDLDQFPADLDGQGSPEGMVDERLKVWRSRGLSKRLKISTPTIKGSSKIDAAYQKADRRRYYFRCPECSDRFLPDWSDIQWDDDRHEEAYLVAPCCGAQIEHWRKPSMKLPDGWLSDRIDGQPVSRVLTEDAFQALRARMPASRKRGFHLAGEISTFTVTAGSPVVTGAGTDFVGSVSPGEAFITPELRVYEIAAVVSATQLTLVGNYAGGTAAGQPYAILPTQSFAHDLALQAAALLGTFGAVRDGIGAGLIEDGSGAVPGIRFRIDQDTGIRRAGANILALVAGGSDRLTADAGGVAIYGSAQVAGAEFPNLIIVKNGFNAWFLGGSGGAGDNDFTLRLGTQPPALRVDTAGNILLGVDSGAYHVVSKAVPEKQKVIGFAFPSGEFAYLKAQQGAGGSAANATFWLNAASDTGRSLNAGGTINASGADYAEYMTKAPGCGTIAPGEVCGVNADGLLTRSWGEAVAWVVKSTDPAYVGGDSWAKHLPPRPEEPAAAPAAPVRPERQPEESDTAWSARLDAYVAARDAYAAAQVAHDRQSADHARDLAAWEAALEIERQKVDRIAFSGQVPVAVAGTFASGDYLIAAANGGGIKAVAVAEDDITFEQYRRRLGRVWRVLDDGRAWADVQHG